jgi:hypothetical protein
MQIKDFAIGFFTTGLIVLLVSLGVTWIYDMTVHGASSFDWGPAVRFAIIFGISFPLIRALENKKKA